MTELGDSLERMSSLQLLVLLGFVTSYVLALGGLLSGSARWWAAALAAGQAMAFAVLTDPWVHGALLVVFVVAGLALFVAASWLLARLLAPRRPVALDDAPASTQTLVSSEPPTQPPRAGESPTPKLARRAIP